MAIAAINPATGETGWGTAALRLVSALDWAPIPRVEGS